MNDYLAEEMIAELSQVPFFDDNLSKAAASVCADVARKVLCEQPEALGLARVVATNSTYTPTGPTVSYYLGSVYALPQSEKS